MPTLPIQVLHFTCTHTELHDRDDVDDRIVDADDDRDDDDGIDDDDDSS